MRNEIKQMIGVKLHIISRLGATGLQKGRLHIRSWETTSYSIRKEKYLPEFSLQDKFSPRVHAGKSISILVE